MKRVIFSAVGVAVIVVVSWFGTTRRDPIATKKGELQPLAQGHLENKRQEAPANQVATPPSITSERATEICARIALLVDEDPAGNRSNVIRELLLLVEENPIAALQVMTTLPHDYGSWVAVELHRMCVEADPEGSANWLSQFKATDSKQLRFASNIFGLLASLDTKKAFDAIADYPPDYREHLFRSGAVTLWANGDPLGALEDAKSYLKGQNLEVARSGIIMAVASDDPDLALSLASDLKGPLRNETLLNIYSRILFKSGPNAALTYLNDAEPALLQQALGKNNLIQIASKEEPETTRNLLSKLVFTASNSFLFEQAAKAMAEKSPSETWEWIATFPDSPEKGNLKSAAMYGITANDSEYALTVLNGLDEKKRSREIEGFASALGELGDTELAMRTLESLNSREAESLLANFGAALATKDLGASIDFFMDPTLPKELIQSGAVQKQITNSTAFIARKDLDSAIEIFDLAPEQNKPALVAGIVAGWASVDAQSASKWLSEQPSGEARNRGISALINEIRATDPELASKWETLLPE